MLFEHESYLIRGACFELYNRFGGDFKESIIEKALAHQLRLRGLNVETQKQIKIVHLGKTVGSYTPDMIVNDKILIELKVKPFLTKVDDRQFWHYLKASSYPLGFLINFGSTKLEIKRRVFQKARQRYKNIRVDPLLRQKSNPRESASKKAGFTLMELLIYFAVFGMIAVAILSILMLGLRSRSTIGRRTEVHLQTKRAMEQIVARVRQGTSINSAATSTLSLSMADANKNPTVFNLSSGAVTIQEGSGPVSPITPSTIIVSSLSFAKVDNPSPATSSVQIKITSGYNQNGQVAEGTPYSLQTTAMPLQ